MQRGMRYTHSATANNKRVVNKPPASSASLALAAYYPRCKMMQADSDRNPTPHSQGSLLSSGTHRRKGKAATPTMATRLVEEVQKDQAVMYATVKRRTCGTGAFDKNWLNLDCCGLFSAGLTYCLHLYGIYAVCFVMLPPWMSYYEPSVTAAVEDFNNQTETTAHNSVRHMTWAGTLHATTFIAIAVMAIISHYLAMTTDPGAVPPDARPLDMSEVNSEATTAPKPGMRLCRRCKAYKPRRAHHCSVCRRCIIKMDHHCPWVNNCVGIGNHKYFLLFVFYTFLSCVYSMTLIIARFSTCVHMHHRRRHHMGAEAAMLAAAAAQGPNATCLDQPSQLLTILGLIIESLLFGMFTSCMMCKCDLSCCCEAW